MKIGVVGIGRMGRDRRPPAEPRSRSTRLEPQHGQDAPLVDAGAIAAATPGELASEPISSSAW